MDWALAIDRNRVALLRIVTALFAMAGAAAGTSVAALPRHLRNRVLRILRPAESAARRLIVMAAREISLPPLSPLAGEMSRSDGEACMVQRLNNPSQSQRKWSLPLLDPLKRFSFDAPRHSATGIPRIWWPGAPDPVFVSKCILIPDDPVDAERLCRRLQALKRALDDLPGQAKRLARWQARSDMASRLMQGGFAPASKPQHKGAKQSHKRYKRLSPLRPGWPPGYRKRPLHQVDDVLRECHALAFEARDPPETR